VGEFHYLHRDLDGSAYADPAEMSARLTAAAEATGIGLTLLPVFYAHSGFGGAPPTAGQRRFVHDLDGFARLLDGARRALRALPDGGLGVAPHSLRAATQAELEALLKLASAGPVHLHIAEQGQEVADCLAWSGERPVEWLLNRFAVDPCWCLVHATHVSPRELERIARSGAVVGLCPITEANLGDGIFPASALLGLGGRFGVGSDSNVLIDPAEELRLLEYGQRLTTHHRNALAAPGGSTGERLFEEALRGGAQAMGVAPDVIAPGAPATFVSIDADHAAFAESRPEEVLDRWVFAARAPAVDCVWRWGRKVVAGGRHLQRQALVADFRTALQRCGA
jgi:formiminoglutamate deiminase